MAARFTLVHADPMFCEALALALRAQGHKVLTITDPDFNVPPPRRADVLEIAVTQATGEHKGVRIRVTGIPTEGPYAGALGQFLADPVDIATAMEAIKMFPC